MIYEVLSAISIIMLLVANAFLFFLQTRFTKGLMKSFVGNSSMSLFFILAERFLDMAGELIYGISNINYHLFSAFLMLGAVLYFWKAMKALGVFKEFLTIK